MKNKLFIFIIAANTRSDAPWLSVIHAFICAGATCHEKPKRSLNQPHCDSCPPTRSAS